MTVFRHFTKIAWSPASGKMKWKPCIKLLLPPNGLAHQQFLLVKDGAQKEDKESARSLVDAARGTVNEVQALLTNATAPEDGHILTIYPKRGELVGAGTPIMSLVVLDDCHVVLNVREDYMPYFRMNENFMGDIPALDVKNKAIAQNQLHQPVGEFCHLAFYQADGDSTI